MNELLVTALCVISIGVGVTFVMGAILAFMTVSREYKREDQKPTKAEKQFAEWLYDAEDCCKKCSHNAECNAPENYHENEAVPKEKCIEGIVKYTRQKTREERNQENG